ncbi:MAG TPA: hypothetical protein VEF89_28995 [Solirubrobacteraceae bacterium]|nr:hypothetical protein [Solirubrobacteraceae bacterium]
MTGARFVHDTLEQLGWEVLIADAQRVKGLAPLACKTDRVDSRVLLPAWASVPDQRRRPRHRRDHLERPESQRPHPERVL